MDMRKLLLYAVIFSIVYYGTAPVWASVSEGLDASAKDAEAKKLQAQEEQKAIELSAEQAANIEAEIKEAADLMYKSLMINQNTRWYDTAGGYWKTGHYYTADGILIPSREDVIRPRLPVPSTRIPTGAGMTKMVNLI